MSKLRRFLWLASLRDDLETRLLREEHRWFFNDDHVDDGSESEIRSSLSEVSRQMSSLR
ncbi:hypothetical protein [Rhizobium tubonense]|uniref:hypothetical protein n=1 Tax=Rhizobium tubonense TaxID=484088 RepID=UPI0018A84E7E|nr:hypothetical protein [Rhizobium tubonense]